MMPLTLAAVGEENIIRKVGGNPEVRAHLENLGFGFRRKRDGDHHHGRQSHRQCERIPGGHQQGNGQQDHDLKNVDSWEIRFFPYIKKGYPLFLSPGDRGVGPFSTACVSAQDGL